ncbi:MAG TPA: hypothetical protein VLA37_08745 [Sphingomonadaceae bacterium]|nr:hypothetical protein [Sphingomonadaceae bacterium]
MTPKNILFLCPDNAIRSIMAEAYLATAGRGIARPFSAGLTPAAEVHPLTVETLRSAGLRCSGLGPKSWQSLALARSPRMDLIVTLGEPGEFGSVPAWPGSPDRVEWRLGEPQEAMGSRFQSRSAFVDLLGEIRMRVDALLLDLPGVAAMRMPAVA